MPETLISPPVSLESRPQIDNTVTRAVESSVQRRGQEGYTGLFALVPSGRVQTGLYIPPWWSPNRDRELRKFWKRCDHLAGAVYTMEARMTAITKKVVPVNPNIREHQIQAEQFTEILDQTPEFGDGWPIFYSKFIEEILTQDNGVFVEIIGDGPSDGPIFGMPYSVAILDSSHCQRTGNSEYPVIFYDENGKPHKMHRSRVMFSSQMPSPDRTMFGVGFCACSRVVNVAQTLVDLLVFKQEKMGSRPHKVILVTQGGLDPQDVANAMIVAENNMDNQGLTRYSKAVLTGSSTITEADIKVVELSSLPDGFDEYDSTILGIAAIALGFGVDARELFPAIGGGATRADAMLSHLKQRGKSPGQLIDLTEKLFNQKFLPPHLRLTFDFQDDAQDRQSAEIGKIRQERWNYAINSGAMNERTVREGMLLSGDIDRSQFERLELSDGRMPDGSSVNTLFYSTDPKINKYLTFSVEDPCDVQSNDAEKMLAEIAKHEKLANSDIINTTDLTLRYYAEICMFALEFLKEQYSKIQFEEEQAELAITQEQGRTRTRDTLTPTDNSTSPSGVDRDQSENASAEE